MNQPVHVPRTLWERLVARLGASSIAVSKDHSCSKVQQWRRATDVDSGQPAEKRKKAGSIIPVRFPSEGRNWTEETRTRWTRSVRGTRRIPARLTIVQEVFHWPSRTVSLPRICSRRGGISWTELERGNSAEIPRKGRPFRSDNSIADCRKSSKPEESRSDATANRKVCRDFRRFGCRFFLSVSPLFSSFLFFLVTVGERYCHQ